MSHVNSFVLGPAVINTHTNHYFDPVRNDPHQITVNRITCSLQINNRESTHLRDLGTECDMMDDLVQGLKAIIRVAGQPTANPTVAGWMEPDPAREEQWWPNFPAICQCPQPEMAAQVPLALQTRDHMMTAAHDPQTQDHDPQTHDFVRTESPAQLRQRSAGRRVTLKPSPGRGGLVRDSAVINQLSLGGLAVGPSSADSEDSEAARSRVTQQCMSLLESYRGGNPKERDEAHSTATEGVVSYKPSWRGVADSGPTFAPPVTNAPVLIGESLQLWHGQEFSDEKPRGEIEGADTSHIRPQHEARGTPPLSNLSRYLLSRNLEKQKTGQISTDFLSPLVEDRGGPDRVSGYESQPIGDYTSASRSSAASTPRRMAHVSRYFSRGVPKGGQPIYSMQGFDRHMLVLCVTVLFVACCHHVPLFLLCRVYLLQIRQGDERIVFSAY
jgi:hypothetical protein